MVRSRGNLLISLIGDRHNTSLLCPVAELSGIESENGQYYAVLVVYGIPCSVLLLDRRATDI